MLDKKLCKICFTENDALWTANDEDYWEEGNFVFCRHSPVIVKVNGEIPKVCPYYLIHGVK